MKRMFCALVALSFLAGPVGPVAAEEGYTKKKAHAKKRKAKKRARATSDYYEHDADKLPYGSKIWWEQMDRENRGGQSGGGGFD